jgi:hypothetical protein
MGHDQVKKLAICCHTDPKLDIFDYSILTIMKRIKAKMAVENSPPQVVH